MDEAKVSVCRASHGFVSPYAYRPYRIFSLLQIPCKIRHNDTGRRQPPYTSLQSTRYAIFMCEQVESAERAQSDTEHRWSAGCGVEGPADRAGWTQEPKRCSRHDPVRREKTPLCFAISAWIAMRCFFLPYYFYNKWFQTFCLGMW